MKQLIFDDDGNLKETDQEGGKLVKVEHYENNKLIKTTLKNYDTKNH